MEKNKLLFSLHHIIIWGMLPFILVVSAVIASLVYYREVSYSTLQYRHPITEVQFPKDNELLPGDTVHGEFIARDNNLGALGISVTTFNRLNNTAIAFRLREKGRTDWYCYNTYFTDRFPNDELYPFGFPVIKDSAGKTYEFEIFAGSGEAGNAIGILKNTKFFVSRYTFDKTFLLSHRTILIQFLAKKSINLFTNVSYLIFLGIFFVPLIVYLLVVLSWKTIQEKQGKFIYQYLLLLFIIAVYVVYPVLMKTNIILFIAFIILLISIIYHISYWRLFTIAAFLLVFCPLWFLIHREEMANRSSILVFFLMVDGLILLSKELYSSKEYEL